MKFNHSKYTIQWFIVNLHKYKIKSQNREIISYPIKIKLITKKYYDQLYGKNSLNLEEMHEFLERHKWPKFTLEEIKHFIR